MANEIMGACAYVPYKPKIKKKKFKKKEGIDYAYKKQQYTR